MRSFNDGGAKRYTILCGSQILMEGTMGPIGWSYSESIMFAKRSGNWRYARQLEEERNRKNATPSWPQAKPVRTGEADATHPPSSASTLAAK